MKLSPSSELFGYDVNIERACVSSHGISLEPPFVSDRTTPPAVMRSSLAVCNECTVPSSESPKFFHANLPVWKKAQYARPSLIAFKDMHQELQSTTVCLFGRNLDRFCLRLYRGAPQLLPSHGACFVFPHDKRKPESSRLRVYQSPTKFIP